MNIRTGITLIAVLAAMTVPAALAQSAGADIYKTKCQMCHGASGMAESGAGKAMKVKPASDPDLKKMSEVQMVDAVRNGMGKMQPYKDKLTDAQIKSSVTYFRTFVK
ncbi:MAG TPA: cytochrome c [Terracidiphilus sp.]|jgi:cytochrome c6|nr:cytochrome c [Terracidiphilus sp.]